MNTRTRAAARRRLPMNSYEFIGEKLKRRDQERKASGSAGVALLRRLAEAQRPRSSFLRLQASVGMMFGPCPGFQALLEGAEPSTWTLCSLKLDRPGHIPLPSAGPTRRFGLNPNACSCIFVTLDRPAKRRRRERRLREGGLKSAWPPYLPSGL